MRAVGLTGGIASGKSFVASALEARGAHIVDTDVLAREVVQPGSTALAEITERFGQEILLPDGSLNRRALREQVFASPEQRLALEAITHPRIRALAAERTAQAALQKPTPAYVLVVIPLLQDKARYGFLHEVVVVDCHPLTQLRRLVARDGISQALAEQMLAAQYTRTQRLALAEHIVINDDFAPNPTRSRAIDLRQTLDLLHQRLCVPR